MRRYNQRLYRVARSILRDASEAEDVMQQAYVNAYLPTRSRTGGPTRSSRRTPRSCASSSSRPSTACPGATAPCSSCGRRRGLPRRRWRSAWASARTLCGRAPASRASAAAATHLREHRGDQRVRVLIPFVSLRPRGDASPGRAEPSLEDALRLRIGDLRAATSSRRGRARCPGRAGRSGGPRSRSASVRAVRRRAARPCVPR